MSFPIESSIPSLRLFKTAVFVSNFINHTLISKGGKRNIWPDKYGYPPDVKKVNWEKER